MTQTLYEKYRKKLEPMAEQNIWKDFFKGDRLAWIFEIMHLYYSHKTRLVIIMTLLLIDTCTQWEEWENTIIKFADLRSMIYYAVDKLLLLHLDWTWTGGKGTKFIMWDYSSSLEDWIARVNKNRLKLDE